MNNLSKEKINAPAKKRSKLVELFNVICHTTTDYPLSASEIILQLQKKGVKCERKTLYKDIETLNNILTYFNYKIVYKNKSYYFEKVGVDYDFTSSELRFLTDAVQSSDFITNKLTRQLSSKIECLASDKKTDAWSDNVLRFEKKKHSNEQVLDAVKCIDDAIERGKKISFLYFYLGFGCKHQYRNNGNPFIVNPIALIFNNGYYYLYCFFDRDDKDGKDDKDDKNRICPFRIDRMENCEITTDDVTPNNYLEELKSGDYKDNLTAFGMWMSVVTHVTICANNKQIGDIYDKFGEQTKLTPCDEDHFKATVLAPLNSIFFSWCMNFGGDLKIVAPYIAVSAFNEHLNKINELYKD